MLIFKYLLLNHKYKKKYFFMKFSYAFPKNQKKYCRRCIRNGHL